MSGAAATSARARPVSESRSRAPHGREPHFCRGRGSHRRVTQRARRHRLGRRSGNDPLLAGASGSPPGETLCSESTIWRCSSGAVSSLQTQPKRPDGVGAASPPHARTSAGRWTPPTGRSPTTPRSRSSTASTTARPSRSASLAVRRCTLASVVGHDHRWRQPLRLARTVLTDNGASFGPVVRREPRLARRPHSVTRGPTTLRPAASRRFQHDRKEMARRPRPRPHHHRTPAPPRRLHRLLQPPNDHTAASVDTLPRRVEHHTPQRSRQPAPRSDPPPCNATSSTTASCGPALPHHHRRRSQRPTRHHHHHRPTLPHLHRRSPHPRTHHRPQPDPTNPSTTDPADPPPSVHNHPRHPVGMSRDTTTAYSPRS